MYELVNPAYQQLFPSRALLGKPILEALPEIATNTVWQTFQQVYQTGQTHEETEMLIPIVHPVSQALEDRYFRYIQQPRFTLAGTPDGVVVFAFEVTALVVARQHIEEREKEAQQLAEELAASNEELRAANEEIKSNNDALTTTIEELAKANQQLSYVNSDMDNFIYTASHDLRAPIANIEGLMKAMMRHLSAESTVNAKVGHLSEFITHSIERFKRTINDLTLITKIQRESMDDVTPVQLEGVLEEVLLDLEMQRAEAGAQILPKVSHCPTLYFSVKNMRSVLYNLVSNAIKYRSPDRLPLIQISCQSEPGFLVLLVEDNGLGMDLTQKDKIFSMFKRLHDHVEGSGIGLYIVKKIIENAGGRIEVESEVNKGSLFKVYFKQ